MLPILVLLILALLGHALHELDDLARGGCFYVQSPY